MPFCPRCGTSTEPGWAHCRSCGARQPGDAAPPGGPRTPGGSGEPGDTGEPTGTPPAPGQAAPPGDTAPVGGGFAPLPGTAANGSPTPAGPPYASSAHPPPPQDADWGQPYGAPTVGAHRPGSVRSIGTAVQVLLWVAAGAAGIAAILAVVQLGHFENVADRPTSGAVAALQDAEDAYLGWRGLEILIALVTGILFIIWLHRAYTQAHSLVGGRLRLGRGWTIGAWFVPVANLVLPKMVVNDAFRMADPAVAPGADWRRRPVPRVVDLWWLAWVAVNVLSWTTAVMAPEEEGGLRWYYWLAVVHDLLNIGTAVLAVLTVRRATERLTHRAERVSTWAAQHPQELWRLQTPR